MTKVVTSFQRKTQLFDSAFDNDRDGCMSALGVSLDVCPIDGDGVFVFPDGAKLALPVDTKNAAGATAASEAAVAGWRGCIAPRCQRTAKRRRFDYLMDTHHWHLFFSAHSIMQVRTMRCCCC